MDSSRGELGYITGFRNEVETEALPGALPRLGNSPQRVNYGLYAEQFSGSAFTAPRHANLRSWLYRIRPAAMHGPFTRYVSEGLRSDFLGQSPSPEQIRWSPLPYRDVPTDFVDGLVTYAGNGSPGIHAGVGIHLYAANQSMTDRWFYNADGELLIVPQEGDLRIVTELGVIKITPEMIVVIPRGLRFAVEIENDRARGYVCENYGAPLRLPDLGPIGANGLADPRHFEMPQAAFEDRAVNGELIAKFSGSLWIAALDHSPIDVVAWHGNYAPYRYDLRKFNTIGSISYDHPDPSIFLVLHSPSNSPGVSNVDFVVFPPRWLTMEDTFRPPYFHRNISSEFMGLIRGKYDAKAQGFVPGGASLHNCMSGHGPDAETFELASDADTSVPVRIADTMAFMFETRFALSATQAIMDCEFRQRDYRNCWAGLKNNFNDNG